MVLMIGIRGHHCGRDPGDYGCLCGVFNNNEHVVLYSTHVDEGWSFIILSVQSSTSSSPDLFIKKKENFFISQCKSTYKAV